VSVTDTIVNTAEAVQEWSLSALKTSDEALIEASKSLAGAIRPAAERLSTQLPPVRPVVENWFDFAEKVLAEQKRLSVKLLGTFEATGSTASRTSSRRSSKKAA
jgi:hypothetical protein